MSAFGLSNGMKFCFCFQLKCDFLCEYFDVYFSIGTESLQSYTEIKFIHCKMMDGILQNFIIRLNFDEIFQRLCTLCHHAYETVKI